MLNSIEFHYLYIHGQVFDFSDRGAGVMTINTTAHVETKAGPMTSVLWVRNIVDALDNLGLDGMALAREAGIDPALFDTVESGVLVSEIVRLWELAVAASGDTAIGLSAANSFRPASMDAMGYAMMSSPTLLDALKRGVRYLGAVTSASNARLERTAQGYCLEVNLMAGIVDVQRQNHEFTTLSILKFLRWIAGPDLNPVLIEFMHAKPVDTSLYIDAFSCPIHFNSAHMAMTFSETDAARILVTANAQMAAIHDQVAEQRISQLGGSENALRVKQLIVQSLPEGEPTRDDIAAKMAISSRTLQRRLQDEGQTFHEILDEVRHNLAKRYLGNEKLSLADVAHLLGFSDQSSFTRAAHRWFDTSPSKYRHQVHGRDK
ncbi:MAG: AraC family transcriptional regulator [Arenimonas sp.]